MPAMNRYTHTHFADAHCTTWLDDTRYSKTCGRLRNQTRRRGKERARDGTVTITLQATIVAVNALKGSVTCNTVILCSYIYFSGQYTRW
ncbi:MAG: hypothetical protein OJF51_000413 [Nitrospira sp.]|jgi:hypothetical protein|nr:MAG: hypothetical protein OJF51_000413 [Nitrospira sp.]